MVFPCGNISALALAMRAMASDRQSAQKMGAKARELVYTHNSIENAMEGIKTALSMLR
jgi:D-alanyl-D-alanine carboxypeptidase